MIHWNRRKYTKEQFIEAWMASASVFEVGRRLGLKATGSGHTVIKDTAVELGLNRDHMTGQGWNRGMAFGDQKPIEFYLVEGKKVGSNFLRKRLVRSGILEECCAICSLSKWRGGGGGLRSRWNWITSTGSITDNRLENLRILCRNCHGQQPTHAGKNRAGAKENAERRAKERADREASRSRASMICPGCNVNYINGRKSTLCRECHAAAQRLKTKIVWPPLDELVSDIENSSYLAVAKRLNVSDVAVRKHLLRNGLSVDEVKALSKRSRQQSNRSSCST